MYWEIRWGMYCKKVVYSSEFWGEDWVFFLAYFRAVKLYKDILMQEQLLRHNTTKPIA